MIAPPRKTDLGQQELRKRTRKLSQRHRTVLLLVDGKRSRAEVLSLAQQAGSAPGLFDELLGLGMVEEPSVPTGPAPLADADAPQVALDAQTESEGQPEVAPAAEATPVEAPVVVAERVEIEIAPPVTDAVVDPPAADPLPPAAPIIAAPALIQPVAAVPFLAWSTLRLRRARRRWLAPEQRARVVLTVAAV